MNFTDLPNWWFYPLFWGVFYPAVSLAVAVFFTHLMGQIVPEVPNGELTQKQKQDLVCYENNRNMSIIWPWLIIGWIAYAICYRGVFQSIKKLINYTQQQAKQAQTRRLLPKRQEQYEQLVTKLQDKVEKKKSLTYDELELMKTYEALDGIVTTELNLKPQLEAVVRRV